MFFKLPFLTGKRDNEAPVVGDDRQQMVDTLHGKHYQDTLRGRVFCIATTPLGLDLPIYTATDLVGGCPIWNPGGSGVNVELIKLNVGRTSGVTAFGNVGLQAKKVGLASLGTGLTVFTEGVANNCLFGAGNASQVKVCNVTGATVTAGVAGQSIRSLFPISPLIDTTAADQSAKEFDFDGTLIMPPGTIVYVSCTKASVALFQVSWVWKEIPI